MTDADLRALVRGIVARQLGGPAIASPPALHTSHGQFVLLTGNSGEPDPCVIEPAVPCTHCGYCKSLGH